jgi:chitodextrinase
VYQSAAFEVAGLIGQLLVALPNLAPFAGAAAIWLRIAGLFLATLYVCVLLLRAFLPDRVMEASAEPRGGLAGLGIRLRAGNRRVVLPVTAATVLVAGFSLFGATLLGLGEDATAPAAPAHLRSTGATAQQVDLAWDPVQDRGSGIREYRVVRRDNGLERASTAASFHDTVGIGGGRTYEYAVVAVDGAGNVSGPSRLAVTTPVSDAAACATDTEPPTAPGAPRATVVTPTSVTLEWGPATEAGNCGLAGYQLLRDGVDTGVVAAGTQLSEDGLEPDHSYVYTVVARDNAGNLSAASEPVTVTTLARPVQTQSPCLLGPPTGLAATGQSTTTVALTWSPPAEDCHLDGYRVYRGGSYVGQTGATSFTVTGLAPSTTYVFTVRAHNRDGEMSPNSNPATATTATPPPPPDTTPPTSPGAPSLLTWTPATKTLAVAWSGSSDPESGLGPYVVYLDGIQQGTTSKLTYSFAGLAAYQTYKVGVRAVNTIGLSTSIVESSLTTGAGPGEFTMGLSPSTAVVHNGTDTTITVSGTGAIPGTRVDVSLESIGVIGSVSAGPDGSFGTSFVVTSDGDVAGTPDSGNLAPGSYQVTVTTPECDCGAPPRSATLDVVEVP